MIKLRDILIGLAKVWGLWWVFVAIPFRGYARSVVYNYVLQNNRRDWLGRLWQRSPCWSFDYRGWVMTGHVFGHLMPDQFGFVANRSGLALCPLCKRKNVSKVEFYLAVFLIWGWLDDDANEDTTSRGFIDSFKPGGERDNNWQVKVFGQRLTGIDMSGVVYGSAFDLGDVRARHPYFNPVATFVWNARNSAMNFQYLWSGY